MKPGIMSIFQKVGCGDEARGETLVAAGVSDNNIVEFLGLLEKRVSEIIQVQHMANADRHRHESMGGFGQNNGLQASAKHSSVPALGRTGDSSMRARRANYSLASLPEAGAGPVLRVPRPPSVNDDSDGSDDETGATSGGVTRPMQVTDLHRKIQTSFQRQQHRGRQIKPAAGGRKGSVASQQSASRPMRLDRSPIQTSGR